MSRIVNATHLDSVRIEVLGESRAVTIPLSLLLAIDVVLRFTLEHEEEMGLWPFDGEGTGDGWNAQVGNILGEGQTPWGAIVDLAYEIKRETT